MKFKYLSDFLLYFLVTLTVTRKSYMKGNSRVTIVFMYFNISRRHIRNFYTTKKIEKIIDKNLVLEIY